jgi:hypothetical protein
MSLLNRTEIVQLDDGRLLSYNKLESQFYLADNQITTETALRYWVDQGIAEPFKDLLKDRIDCLVQLVDSKMVA